MTQAVPRLVTGASGEDVAADYLRGKGWLIAARNWRCPYGEIDIIAVDEKSTVVFVEVKTRRGRGYGDPLEAITYAKVRKLRQLVSAWLQEQPKRVGRVRLDGVGVLLVAGREPVITHAVGITQ